VAEVRGGAVRTYTIVPEDVGVGRWPPGSLAGGDAEHNARITRDVLSGQAGAPRDAVLANAAAALVAAGAAPDLRAGARLAADAVDRGAAREKLDLLVAASRE
jgi:anthranilate phosphoribosyltransferase